MLSGTLGTMVDRHNANVANRQARDNAARAALAERERANRKASDDFLEAYERAHPLIQRNLEAAAKGDVEALRAAGLQYLDGRGVAKDPKKGLSLLNDAAKRNDHDAQMVLARLYSDGEAGITQPDPIQGHRWNLALAEFGDTNHMTLACSEFIHGKGTPVDLAGGEKWCTAAMNKGDATAANNLGVLYTGSEPGVKPDLVKARTFFEKSVVLHSDKGRENLEHLYAGLLGGEPDYKAALALYQEGAARNDGSDECDLAILYITGTAVTKDIPKGIELLKKAIKDGSARASSELGAMYVFGIGAPEDKALGLKLWRQAAVQGYPQALFRMGIRTMNGDDGIQQDQIEGERLLHLAADNGDADAPHVLGQIYLNGYGVEKDPAAARKWFKLGVERGDQESAAELKKMG